MGKQNIQAKEAYSQVNEMQPEATENAWNTRNGVSIAWTDPTEIR